MESPSDYKNICNHKQFIRRYISKRVQSNDEWLVKNVQSMYLVFFFSLSLFPVQKWQWDLQCILKQLFGDETQPAAKYRIISR